MVIVGFDTATGATAAAASLSGSVFFRGFDQAAPGERPRHAERLLPMIEQAATEAGGWASVDRIAVGIGPGTFTGIRIGVVTARALAHAHGCELAGIETTRALAARAARELGRPACGVVDGKRGEVFASAVEEGGKVRWGPVVESPAQIAARLGAEGFEGVVVGDGAAMYSEQLTSAAVELPAGELDRIDAAEICRLGEEARPVDPSGLEPLYLRRPDAELWIERDA